MKVHTHTHTHTHQGICIEKSIYKCCCIVKGPGLEKKEQKSLSTEGEEFVLHCKGFYDRNILQIISFFIAAPYSEVDLMATSKYNL